VRHKNYVPVNELTYGTTIEPVPFIPVSQNGVHYNPYQSKRKTFVSLGRGDKGNTEAERVQWEWLLKILASHNWTMPDEIDTPYDTPSFGYESGPSLAVGFRHPTLGHVYTQLRFPFSGHGQGHVIFSASPLLFMLAARGRVDSPPLYFRNGNLKQVPMSVDQDWPNKFRKDPWRVGYELYTGDWAPPVNRVLELLNPPDMSRASYAPDIEATEKPWARQTHHADLYRSPELIKQATFEGLPVLERALAAFKHMGVMISVTTTYSAKGEPILDGLTVSIPGDNSGTNHLGHDISINSRGISVDCGYVLDDERHRGYQMREARKFLEHVQEYEESSFKIERPTEGEE
jgi:hypothetical protein